jgi:hypothetical protein
MGNRLIQVLTMISIVLGLTLGPVATSEALLLAESGDYVTPCGIDRGRSGG